MNRQDRRRNTALAVRRARKLLRRDKMLSKVDAVRRALQDFAAIDPSATPEPESEPLCPAAS